MRVWVKDEKMGEQWGSFNRLVPGDYFMLYTHLKRQESIHWGRKPNLHHLFGYSVILHHADHLLSCQILYTVDISRTWHYCSKMTKEMWLYCTYCNHCALYQAFPKFGLWMQSALRFFNFITHNRWTLVCVYLSVFQILSQCSPSMLSTSSEQMAPAR